MDEFGEGARAKPSFPRSAGCPSSWTPYRAPSAPCFRNAGPFTRSPGRSRDVRRACERRPTTCRNAAEN